MDKGQTQGLKALFEQLMELIYPSNIYCISCGNLIDKTRPYALCDSCVRTLRWNNKKSCTKCGKILAEDYNGVLCTDCKEIQHAFERGFSCVEYGRREREIVRGFKYKDKAYMGRNMSAMMADRIETEAEELSLDFILAVPMFAKKQRLRGYNQAEILAKYLSRSMNLPFYGDVLLRDRPTEPMSNLGAEERRENIKAAFSVAEKRNMLIRGKNILLIDDIFTTGSTMDECSHMLLQGGADRVYAYAFASGANLAY